MKRFMFAWGIALFLACFLSLPVQAGAGERTLKDRNGREIGLAASDTPGFSYYINSRFGFAVEVSDLFTKAIVIPDNGDGVILADEAEQALFRASGGNIIDKKNLKRRFEEARKELGSAVAYAHLGKDSYVLSWTEGSDIHYRKVLLGSSIWCDMELTYPATRKKEFDPIVVHSAKSLCFTGR